LETPWWPPGSALGYHAITWGWLAGELVRRIDGRSVGRFLREEVTTPLGLDLHLGAPPEIDVRVASIALVKPRIALPVLLYWLRTPKWMGMRLRVFGNPEHRDRGVDTRAWRAAEIPAMNGISNARSLARLYGVLARGGEGEGVRLLGPTALARATRQESEGRERVFGFRMRFGLGFMLDSPTLGIAPDSRCFGHTGAGGGFGFADPERRLGFAYTPNWPHGQRTLLAAPARDLIRAIYASLPSTP
jgi:CubicO group peptidase (beta-lactamase class C family)